MPNPDPQRVTELRALIAEFLQKRLNDKLEKLGPDDPKRAELQQSFIPAAWLEDAAQRVGQIQAATHTLKPIHPVAKGTNLYASPQVLPELTVVGSHCLDQEFASDVVGNAAALDVHKFLKLAHRGKSLLSLAMARDADLAASLSDEPAQATAWIEAFAGLVEPRGRVASHTLAKQLYWPTGGNPHDDASYHLLAPLYASSLAHHVFQAVQDDRFSDEAKAAREARKAGQFSDRPVREYREMAVQKIGGSNQQNVSQLNSERGGNNYLLSSLPPVWRAVAIKALLNTESMFLRYGRRSEVKLVLKTLLAFLKSNPSRTVETRLHRSELVDALIDEFLQFSAELSSLPAGWSQSIECKLSSAEKHWLDPDGVEHVCAASGRPLPTDTDERISTGFANWLNAQLRDSLPMGDPEFLEWRRRMHEQIKAEEREGNHAY